jgi:isorenieratene synthase
VKRRELLKSGAAGAAVGVSMASLPACGPSTRDQTVSTAAVTSRKIPAPKGQFSKLPDEEKSRRRVCIVGGGIAGLSAAFELAERNYDVTIKEREAYLGGRLHTRMERRAGEDFAVEHGLHMWFFQYYNFQDILQRLGVWDKNFRDFKEVYFEFKPPLKPEIIRSEGPYPLNLIKLLNDSPNLNLLTAAGVLGAIGDVVFYNHSNNNKRLDSLTFEEWMDRGRVNETFRNVVLRPAASVTLNDPKSVSAAEMVMFQHLYFLGHPKAFHRKVTTTDHESAVIAPWAQKIRDLGGSIQTSTPISGLELKGGRIAGIRTGDSVEAFDEVILALDVPGLKAILTGSRADQSSAALLASLRQRVSQLKVAPQYSVLRVWFDKPIDPNRPFIKSVVESSEYKPINLLAIMSMLEEQSRDWANRNNGSVVEYHLYNTPQFNGLKAEEIWEKISENALTLVPELKEQGARPLDFSLGQFENFTSYEVGQATIRPLSSFGRQLGVPNLAFCGDCISTTYPSALMERAVSTGREAANLICQADRVDGAPLEVASSSGPGIIPRL